MECADCSPDTFSRKEVAI